MMLQTGIVPRGMKRKLFVTAPPHPWFSRLPSHMQLLYCTVLTRMKSLNTAPLSTLLRGAVTLDLNLIFRTAVHNVLQNQKEKRRKKVSRVH